MKTVLEYVWLDANEKLRSKTKVAEGDINSIEKVPVWSYDGSSTDQASGYRSDCILTPVKLEQLNLPPITLVSPKSHFITSVVIYFIADL